MTWLAGLFLAAAVTSALTWQVSKSMFDAPVLQRRNFRGASVPVAAGVVLVVATIAVEAVLSAVTVGWPDLVSRGPTSRSLAVMAALGFGLLGCFDDLAAHGDERGFRGHVRSMLRGRLSTGGLKLAAGGLLSVIVVARTGVDSLVDLGVGAVLLALAANLGNLFDRAPGRTIKVGLLSAIVLVATTAAAELDALSGPVLLLGAGAGLLWADLREELMLGDAGSNVLGAALGLGVVATCGRLTEAIVLLVLLALNAASERVSFSKVIAAVAPLRAIDMAGRRPSSPS